MKKKIVCAILVVAFFVGFYFICLENFNKANANKDNMTCTFTYVNKNNQRVEATKCTINNYVKTCDGNIDVKLYWEDCK